jgi:hypothetical protein
LTGGGPPDLHLNPYYGDEEETEALYFSQAKRGTTTFHTYATLYARVRSKRYTLPVRQLVAGDTSSDILAEFLELVDWLDFSVKAVYLDRRFYNSPVLDGCTRTTTPTRCRSSSGAKRFRTSSTGAGAARLNTISLAR